MGKRALLFVGTNLAVMVVFGAALTILSSTLGIDANGIVGLMILSVIVGMAGSFISLAMSKGMAKRAVGATVIDQPRNDTERWVLETTHRLADEAGIGRPEVAIYDSPDLNAFATGAKRNDSLVAVSTGLLKSMRKNEVEAVLAHEVSHISNGDMVTMTLLQGVLNTLVFFLASVIGQFVDRQIFGNRGGRGLGYFLTRIVLQILLGILASFIVMAYSRRREFRADAGGASLTSNEDMAQALERLGSIPPQQEMPDQVEAMGISSGKPSGIKTLLRSHPPIEDRIAALRS
ncbi:MAG: protease HtpX [Acidimicrobiales bacterium]